MEGSAELKRLTGVIETQTKEMGHLRREVIEVSTSLPFLQKQIDSNSSDIRDLYTQTGVNAVDQAKTAPAIESNKTFILVIWGLIASAVTIAVKKILDS